MVTRATVPTPSALQSAIVRDPLMVAPGTTVMAAIAYMSGVRAPCSAAKTADGQLDDLDRDAQSSCVLVVEDGRLLGLLTERDVVRIMAQQQSLEALAIQTVMTCPVITLQEADFTDLFFALTLLHQHHIHHLPILGEQGELLGLVTQTSLLHALNPLALDQLVAVQEEVAVLEETVTRLETEKVQLLETHTVALEEQVEARLRESERYVTLSAAAPVGIFRTDAEGNSLYINQWCCEMLGLPPDATTGDGWQKALHPDDRASVRAEIMLARQENRLFQMEYRILRPDGTVIWVLGRAVAEYGSDGQVIGYVGTLTDISEQQAALCERKQAEAALLKSEAQSRAILAAMPDFMFRIGADGRYRECVTANHEIDLLHPEFNPVGLAMVDILPAELASRHLHHLEQALRTGEMQVYEQQIQIGDRLQDEEVRVVKIGDDEVLFMVRDMSKQQAARRERKQAEQQLYQLNQALEANVEARTAQLQRREAELQKLSERLTLSLKSGAIGCWDWDLVQNTIAWDERMYALYGVTKQAETRMVYDLWASGLHPDDRAATEAFAQRVILGEVDYDTEFRVIHPDGSIHFIKAYGVLVRDAQGNPESIIGVNFDISDRKQAEQTIRQQAEQEKLLREITQRMRQSLDLQTIFDTACQEIRQVIQADRVGIFKFAPETNCNDGEFVAEAVVAGFPSVVAMQVHDHCFGDKYAPLYVQGQYAAMDDIYRLEECYANVLALFQVRANLVMPLICGDALWGLLCLHQCATTRHWQQSEIDFIQQIANQLAIAIQQAHLFEQLQQELAERQQAETKLTESNQRLALSNEELARATRLKDEFLANMSHELRTPLNAILGMSEALQEHVFGIMNERQLKALQTVENSGSHLLELINDILDVAKIEAGQITLDCTPTSIHHLCQSSLAFIKQQALQKGIELDIKLPSNLPDLLVDERRLRQVVINLLNNAVKFTPDGGRITLEARRQKPQPLGGSASWLQLSVTDTGIGIAPEHLTKLFQPFVQIDSALNRQYTGTGLGLALVKQLVELHGGRVGLTSTLGAGSCFTIDLPCIPLSPLHPELMVSETAALAASPLDETVARSPLILLVEDNDANIMTISSYLEAKGYRLLLAQHGQAAIDLATAHQPDLILMDIQMPGMDGLEAMRQIRTIPNLDAIPIIALTALAMEGDRQRCLEAGATDYLTKPVRLKALSQLLQTLLAP